MKNDIKSIANSDKVEVILQRQLIQLKGGGKIKKQEPKAG